MVTTQFSQTLPLPHTPTHQWGHDYDLVIVGGGIIGLTLASALKDSGFQVLLIEAKVASAAVAKGQAYAVHMLSAKIYQGIGIWSKMLPQIAKYNRVRLSDAEYPDTVEFTTADLDTPELGYVAEHQALLQPLQEFVQSCANVTYLCPAEVLKIEYQQDVAVIEVQINQQIQTIRSKLVVAD